MLKIAICDDEPASCDLIYQLLKQHKCSSEFNVSFYYTGEELYSDITKFNLSFDLLILDISMKMIDGVEIGKIIRRSNLSCDILYVSSKTEYALHLFDIRPINFLVKPLDHLKFHSNIDYILSKRSQKTLVLSTKNNKKVYKIPVDNIMYIERNSRKVNFIMHFGEPIEMQIKFADLINKLPPSLFVQTHNSFIVNWNFVKRVTSRNIVLLNDQVILISRTYKDDVIDFHSSFLYGN